MLVAGFVIWRRGGISIIEAVREGAGERFAVSHYALIELRRVLLEIDLDAWERHPARLRAESRALFRRAIGRLSKHRGGWSVDRRPPPEAA